LAVALLVLGAASSASASEPVGTCPGQAYDGPFTVSEIIAMFPPPPGIPAEEQLTAQDMKGNADGFLCVRPHPNGVGILVIDNRANVAS
jgi:hypothetical protein